MDLDTIVKSLNKKLDKKIAFHGHDTEVEKVDVIPTGIVPLDYILGIGGIPMGRITDIYGLPSVGKSTICFSIIAQAQKKGIKCAIIDAEYSYIPEYAEKFGINADDLLVTQPDCLEEAGTIISELIDSGIGLIIVDSVSSLLPKALAEADHGKSPMAMQARGMSQMLMKIIAPLSKKKVALVCVNQMRINIMAMHAGDKYTVTGGWALKFYSSIRIEMKRLKAIMRKSSKGDENLGYIVGFKIKKNKTARPNRSCEVPYRFESGFEKDGDLVQMGVDAGLIEAGGAWYKMGENKWQGKDKARIAIEATPTLRNKIVETIFPQQ